MWDSVYSAISAILRTASTGYLPAADSPESIMADVPSYTAFATSEISALVGLGLLIIDSNISVAVITRLPNMRHFWISIFWIAGTSTKGISTPRSPLATIIPSQYSHIASILSMPERFSIFAIISIFSPPFSLRKLWSSIKSFALETNDAAIKSTPFLIPNRMSALSCSDKYGPSITLFGKHMLFRLLSVPPIFTSHITSLFAILTTSNMTSPLLTNILSPIDKQFAMFL